MRLWAGTGWRVSSGGMNFLRQVLAAVERVEGDVPQVRDEDRVKRTIANRQLEVGDTVKLVFGVDRSVIRVLDT